MEQINATCGYNANRTESFVWRLDRFMDVEGRW